MSILDRISINKTLNRRPGYIVPKYILEFKKLPVNVNSPSFEEEYQIRLEVSVNFWSTNELSKIAIENAERVLLNDLYKDTLSNVDIAIHAIWNRDFETATSALYSIRKEILGDKS